MSAEHFVHAITVKSKRHLLRPKIVRVLLVALGFLLLVPGTPLFILFPEAGIPLVFAGLGILSLEYVWAARILLWFAKIVDKLIHCYRCLPKVVRYSAELLFLIIAIFITWIIFW